jgi:single-stranded-DNA-specific exonuclease
VRPKPGDPSGAVPTLLGVMAEPAVLRELESAPPPALRVIANPDPTPPQRPSARIEIPPYELASALRLERELGVSHAFAQILVRRGLAEPAAARAFLEGRQAYDPAAFRGLDQALALIRLHISGGTRITVHGDYDVDGVCATALLVRALRSLGANAGWYLPSRLEDGYGLASHTVERLASSGTELLLTVDCGITAVSEVERALAKGLGVVVTDHHAPRADGVLPDCPIVHPTVCGYPCPDLCGTGVAFKLAQALGALTAAEDIELVALATVADLMPLRGENRRLVRAGLRALAGSAKPGLRALMAVARADPSALDAHVLGFRLAPRINAAGRMRRPDAGLELLLTDDEQRAREIATELDHVNAERRAVEERITWEAERQAVEVGQRSAYVLAAEGWHPGVIGIVASRIVERFHRPAIVIALDGAHGQGSCRSIPGFDLLAALHASASELERYGGHRAAAGLSLARERLPAFAEAIERHAEAMLSAELLEPVERVDAVVSGTELGLAFAEELRMLEPCGIGNPGPSLFLPGSRFGDPRALGDGSHVSFAVTSGGTRARAVAFGCGGRLPGEPGQPLDATFKLERNEWRGTVEARLILRQARPCSPSPIEVLGEREDYMRAALAELDAPLETGAQHDPRERVVLDRRGESPLAVLADAVATGEGVMALCADVPRRLHGLSARVGAFALSSYSACERAPELGARFAHLVALDPPSSSASSGILRAGAGFTHMAWGEAELRFAQQIHELEYGLRASLAALYRELKRHGRVAGEELEQLLRGDGRHGRPARVAGRLIRVLAELELVSLDPDLPALEVTSDQPTELERSPAYREYARRYEDGRRYLSNGNHQRRSG